MLYDILVFSKTYVFVFKDVRVKENSMFVSLYIKYKLWKSLSRKFLELPCFVFMLQGRPVSDSAQLITCHYVTHLSIRRCVVERGVNSDLISLKIMPGASDADTKRLWSLLRHTGNWGVNKQTVSHIDPNQINDCFANIATDPDYDRSAVIKAALRAPHHAANFVKYTRDSIELIFIRRMKDIAW